MMMRLAVAVVLLFCVAPEFMKSRLISVVNRADLIPLMPEIHRYVGDAELLNAHTAKAKRGDLALFSAFAATKLGGREQSILFGDISASMVEAFKRERLAIESVSTVRRRLATLSHFFGLLGDKHGRTNVGAVKKPAPGSVEFRGLTDSQYELVMQRSADLNVRDAFALKLLARTGLRSAEALGLCIADVSDDWRFLRVVGKGQRVRDVPISPALLRDLMTYLDWRQEWPTRPEFPLLLSAVSSKSRSPESFRLSAKSLWRICNRVLASAGVASSLCHPHALRHTFARRLLAQLSVKRGAADALNTVRLVLGHTSLATTSIYLSETKENLYDALVDVA